MNGQGQVTTEIGVEYNLSLTKFTPKRLDAFTGTTLISATSIPHQFTLVVEHGNDVVKFIAGGTFGIANYTVDSRKSCADARGSYGYYSCGGKGLGKILTSKYGVRIGLKEVIPKFGVGFEQYVNVVRYKPYSVSGEYLITEYYTDEDSTITSYDPFSDHTSGVDASLNFEFYIGILKEVAISANSNLQIKIGHLFAPEVINITAGYKRMQWQFGLAYYIGIRKSESAP